MKNCRYRKQLFAKFGLGVQFDEVGFESAKSERVAAFAASVLPGKRVFDAFSGIGGSAIAFARAGRAVVSVEIDRKRSEMARHNAGLYGVQQRIEFVVGDALKVWRRYEFDVAYFDPPWGGLGYERRRTLGFGSFSPNILPLVRKLVAGGKNVGVTVPLNFDLNELKQVRHHVRLYYDSQYGKPYCIHCIWLRVG